MQQGGSFCIKRTCRVAFLLIMAFALPHRASGAEVSWLPSYHPAPTLIADPHEPRMEIAWFPADEHLHAILGGLFPFVGFRRQALEVALSLDGGAWLELGIEDNLFPLETVDGAFGLRVDAKQGLWRATLRGTHTSAHKADGDSTVAYPPQAVSREFATLEAGIHPGSFYSFVRIGAAWHSIPETSGAMVAIGAQWRAPRGTWRPIIAAHYDHDPARGDTPTWFLFAGAQTGGRPFCLGVCWWKGPGPGGQHFEQHVNRFGIEMQLAPLSR